MSATRRLVILEDDLGTRMLLHNAAETCGWWVETGTTSDDVWGTLRQADAMTLDVHLEKENGLDLLRRLRQTGSTIPVVVLSGDERPEVEAEARAAGATHFLLKPFDVAELLHLLERLCRGDLDDVVIDLTAPEQLEPVPEKAWFMS